MTPPLPNPGGNAPAHQAAPATATADKPPRPHLDRATSPDMLAKFTDAELHSLAQEVRDELIDVVSQTGGHFGANLGVVELTVALHAVFNTPTDRLVWDVGHQAYPHKMLTGRRSLLATIRQGGGLSGFTKRSESPFDPFGTAHSSTSISAALGMAVARDLAGGHNRAIAVIGDGAMSAGMAYEALNNAGVMRSKLIVILNDNEMSIAKPVGAMSAYLSRLTSSGPYQNVREAAKMVSRLLPPPLQKVAAKAEETARLALAGTGTLFEEMGFYYIGPLDGHNLDQLLPVLRNLRDNPHNGPVLLHVITQKGKGYAPAETADDKMHGVVKFDVATGAQAKAKAVAPSYTNVMAQALIAEAEADANIVAITAAMPTGTGLDKFGKAFPDRTFDVGIAEQHAVTFAAGLATEGIKPFCAIYSTFLQRAYDQVVHDVALQNLPVRFVIDRAGLVGADGATHAGSFDVAYLGCLPNMVVMAASDEQELMDMVATAAAYSDGPIALRYPRGDSTGLPLPAKGKVLPIGKGRIIQKGSDIALLCFGTRLAACREAAKKLEAKGHSVTLADARFAKPLDTQMISQLMKNHKGLITIEEGSIGGFGSFVLDYLANSGQLNGTCQLRTMHLPDVFQDHDSQDAQYRAAGLDADSIAALAASLLS